MTGPTVNEIQQLSRRWVYFTYSPWFSVLRFLEF